MHEKIQARLERYEMDQLDRFVDQPEGESMAHEHQSGTESSPQDNKFKVRELDFFEKLDLLANTSLHAIATQAIVVNEGNQRAVAGVIGVFYDYVQFVRRFLNTTNTNSLAISSRTSVKCGYLNDTTDCLLVDNNGYIVVSEELEFIGRHLNDYEPTIMSRLVTSGVFHEINVTDYQSICVDQGEKQSSATSGSMGASFGRFVSMKLFENLTSILSYFWTVLVTVCVFLCQTTSSLMAQNPYNKQQMPADLALPSMMSLIPNKTYLRPCEKVLTRYETRPAVLESDAPEYFMAKCNCPAWFVYEQVSQTNLILIIVDAARACTYKCEQEFTELKSNQDTIIIGQNEGHVCSMIERESKLEKRALESCYSHHPDEEHIRLCGSAVSSAGQASYLLIMASLLTAMYWQCRSTNERKSI